MTRRFAWLRRHGPALFGVLLLVGALFVVQREFRHLSVNEIRAAMAALPIPALAAAALWTIAAYLLLTVYDRLGSIYAGHKVSWPRSFLAAFCGYSLAHNLGFAAVSGAAVRFRFYSAWGLSTVEIGKVIGFTSLTFGLGAMTLGGLVLLVEPELVPWAGAYLPRWGLQALAIPLWGVVAAYIVLSRFLQRVRLFGHMIELPSTRLALAQTLLATADVAVTGMIFYALLPPAEGLTFLRFIGIYLAAYTAGLVANVPGGLGVFDGAILLGLAPYLPAPQVVGALLVFRLYYYIIPLFIAGGLFAAFELGQRQTVLARFAGLGRGAEPLEAPVMASLVALAGTVLLFLGALPVKDTVIEAWVGATAAVASHFAASVLGSLLLVMAYGLLRRLKLAYWGALGLLVAGGAIAWARGEAWWLWGAFALLAGLLASFRPAFYRIARLIKEPLSPEAFWPMLAVAGCALTLALVAYDERVAEDSWWQVALSPFAPDSLRFTVVLTVLLLLVGVVRLLRPAPLAALAPGAALQAQLAGWGAATPAAADAVLLGAEGRAGIALRQGDAVWMGLGDPAGEADDRVSCIWRLRDLCDREGVEPAFWDVGPELLRVYEDIGLAALALPPGPGGAARLAVARAGRSVEDLAALLPPMAR